MKKLLLLCALLGSANLLFAQAQEGMVSYEKTHRPAAVIYLSYPPDVVHAAMDDYLSKKGAKSDQLKGFKTFRNTRLQENDSLFANLYFKVTRMSRDDKDKSIVYLLAGTPEEDAAINNLLSSFTVEQAKEVLNQLAPVIEAFHLEQLIKEQNEVVIKAEKRYKNLLEEGTDLNKSKADLEDKIIRNRHDQEKQSTEVNKQKQALSLFVSKRKS